MLCFLSFHYNILGAPKKDAGPLFPSNHGYLTDNVDFSGSEIVSGGIVFLFVLLITVTCSQPTLNFS